MLATPAAGLRVAAVDLGCAATTEVRRLEGAMRVVLQVLGWVAGGGAVVAALFVVAFRTGFQPVLRLVRRMNRRVLNPRQLRTAGGRGAAASVVRHVGRRSGTPYETPVVMVPTTDGFAMALPYGTTADWVRNVLAAGTATILHEGEAVPVRSPSIVGPAEVAGLFDDELMNRIFGIDEFLVVHRATSTGDEGHAGPPTEEEEEEETWTGPGTAS